MRVATRTQARARRGFGPGTGRVLRTACALLVVAGPVATGLALTRQDAELGPRELRLAADRADLRARLEALELAGDTPRLLASLEAIRSSSKPSDGYYPLDGWALGRHELEYLLEINQPAPETPEGPVLALDFEREGHALPVIQRYAEALRARDIDLLVVPVPNRAQLWGERLPGVGARGPGSLGDLGSVRLLLALNAAGVEVVDLLGIFAPEREYTDSDDDRRVFRNYNPHWAPHGVVLAADALAERISGLPWFERGPDREGVDFFLRREHLEHVFSKQGMEPELEPSFAFERVLDAEGARLEQRDRASPILLIGDSYADIYRAEGADLGSQLHARLGLRLDCIAVANGGATTVWQAVARRRDELQGKRLVIWLFRIAEFRGSEFRSIQLFGE